MSNQANIFEQASRQALRIETRSGDLSVEQLWGLPLQHQTRINLDEIGIDLRRQIKEINQDGESLVTPNAKSPATGLQLAFDIVVHIIGVKKEEAAAARKAEARKAERQRLLELKDNAQRAEEAKLSPAEIDARLAALDAEEA